MTIIYFLMKGLVLVTVAICAVIGIFGKEEKES